MPQRTSVVTLGQLQDLTGAIAPSQMNKDNGHDHNTSPTSSKSPSASPPAEVIETTAGSSKDVMKHPVREEGSRRGRDPPSPRRSTSSPSPPPHIPSTARCSSHAESERDVLGDAADRKRSSKGRHCGDEPARLRSGRGTLSTTKSTLGSGRASTALPERTGNAMKKKAKLVTRTMGTLRPREKERTTAATTSTTTATTAAGGASGRASHSHHTGAPVSGSSSTPAAPADSAAGTTVASKSGGPLFSSCTTLVPVTTPSSARTSAVVEAFLLGLQNCLSKQELLFQRLYVTLSCIDGRLPTGQPPHNAAPPGSSSFAGNEEDKRTGRLSSPSHPQPWQGCSSSRSPTNATSSDYEPDAGSLRYSVGTPAESPLGPASAAVTATAVTVVEERKASASSPHTPQRDITTGSQAAPPDEKLLPSFDSQVQTLPSPHTPSCSIVVVHPTLERALASAVAPTTSTTVFLQSTEPPPPPASLPTATSLLTSPDYLLDNIEVTTSTSATPSSISEQLGVLSSSASATPPSPTHLRSTQRRQQQQQQQQQREQLSASPAPSAPATAAPSPSLAATPGVYTPPAPFVLTERGSTHTTAQQNSLHRLQQHAAGGGAAPARRSSAVQVGSGAVDTYNMAEGTLLQHTPTAAAAGPSVTGGAGGRYPPFRDWSMTPPSSAPNPPPLPAALHGFHRSHSDGVLAGAEMPGTWLASPPGVVAGSSGPRLTTVSNAMSLLTSIDSVTLSPLSRPMSTWGGSPMTHSMHSSGSPVQLQPRQLQLQQQQHQQHGMANSSFNTAGGTPNSTRSPSGTAAGRGSGSSPHQRSTAAVGEGGVVGGIASTPVSTSSPHSPVLFNFVSPPSAAAISSNVSPLVFDSSSGGGGGVLRPPQLQSNVLLSTSSVLSSRNAVISAAGGSSGGTGSGIPVPPHACRLSGDVLSPLSASSLSPSSTLSTVSRRASLTFSRNIAKAAPAAASDSLSHYNSNFVSANSLDEEVRVSVSGMQTTPHSSSSHGVSRAGHSAPTLPSFLMREGDGDASNPTIMSNFVVVSVQSPMSGNDSVSASFSPASRGGGGAAAGTSGSMPACAAGPTHRQLALSTSPSVERASREDGVSQRDTPEALHGGSPTNAAADAVEGNDKGGDDGAVMGISDAASRDADNDPVEPRREVAPETLDPSSVSTTTTTTTDPTPFNPFAIPTPPSLVSELHAHQRQRRPSAAPVPTMRRPPMAPSRPGNATDDVHSSTAANDLFGNGDDGAGGHRTCSGSGSGGRAVQLEQWLPFERQHEQMHLPACWRDSEVVVVDHVEEEVRERDEEAEARLRLLEAELMGGWQATPSGSERDDSQARDDDAENRQQRRRSRRHSYPGNSTYFSDRDRVLFGGSDTTAIDDAGDSSSSNNGDDDGRKWDDEAEVETAYQERLAQYGRMVLLQRRRSLHAPRYRSQTTANNSINNSGSSSSGGVRSSAVRGLSRRRHHRVESEREEGGDNTASLTPICDADKVNNADYLCTSPSPTPLPREKPEAQRLFRRGHSAPSIVSEEGASTDWLNLRARFNELVTIQQRVRGAGEEGTAVSTSAVRPSGDGSGTSRGTREDPATEAGAGSSYGRLNSELLRSRRHRSRSYGHRGFADASTFAMTEHGRTADAVNTAADLRLPTALQTSALKDGNEGCNDDGAAAASSSVASILNEKGRRRTLTHLDDGRVEDTASAALPDRGASLPREGAVLLLDTLVLAADVAQEKLRGGDTTTTAPQAAAEGAVCQPARVHADTHGSSERSHSAPPGQTLEAERVAKTCAPLPGDGDVIAERQPHRISVITAVHKDPPAFLSSTQPAVTVDASHAVGRPVATAAVAASAATAATTTTSSPPPATRLSLDPAQLNGTADDGGNDDDTDETTEEVESFPSSDDSKLHGTTSDRTRTVVKAGTPVMARPSRTPRLRFTHTPRGTTRPNALGRVRRVVILHRASAEEAVTAVTTTTMTTPLAVPWSDSDKRREGTTTDVRKTPIRKTTKKKRASALSSPSGVRGSMTRAVTRQKSKKHPTGPAGEGGGRRTAASTKRRGSCGSAGHAVEPAHAVAATSVASAERKRAGLVAPLLKGNEKPEEGGTTTATVAATSPSSARQLTPHNTHSALDGGEVAEPLPSGTSGASHAPFTALPTSAAALSKAEGRPSNPTNTTAAARRRSVGADNNDARGNAAARRENHRAKEEEDDDDGPRQPIEGEAKRPADNVGSGGTAEMMVNITAESRALLRRLAQRKDRTRAMEERLRMSSGNFTSINTALAMPALDTEDGTTGCDSVASTPMRFALKSQASPHAEGPHAAPMVQTSGRRPSLPPGTEEALTTTVISPLTAPLSTASEGENGASAAASVPNSFEGKHHSGQRHVSVVEPGDGLSVPFATNSPGLIAGQHSGAAATTGGKPNTRRRLVDVRTRQASSKSGTSSSTLPTTAPAVAGQRHLQTTGKTPASSFTSAATGSAAAPLSSESAGGAATAASGSAANLYRRGDGLRPHQRTASPLASSLSSHVAHERRRHTIGDVPFSAVPERRLRPTRTPINS
jgi:hypothetical protein